MCCYVYDPKSQLLEAEMLLPPNLQENAHLTHFQATFLQYKNMQNEFGQSEYI
jgi:hypothetical protein